MPTACDASSDPSDLSLPQLELCLPEVIEGNNDLGMQPSDTEHMAWARLASKERQRKARVSAQVAKADRTKQRASLTHSLPVSSVISK